VLAAISASVSAICIGFAIFHKIYTGLAIPGWASTTSAIAFFGAIQSLGIAILGEYIARIYDQVRNRPMYIVARTTSVSQNRNESGQNSSETLLLQQIETLQRELREIQDFKSSPALLQTHGLGIGSGTSR
jgi:dolichol-phosphate mannosyltransferase